MKRSLKFRLVTCGIGSILGVATGLSVYSSFTLKDELVEKSQAQSEMVLADSIKLPPGGRVIIFDDAGTIVGFTGNAKAIYKNVFSEKFDQYENLKKDRITNKEDFHLGEFNLSALRPIHLDGKTWFAEIVIPRNGSPCRKYDGIEKRSIRFKSCLTNRTRGVE